VLPEPRLEHFLFGPRAAPVSGDFIAYGPGRAQDAAVLPLLWEMMFKPQPMPDIFRRRFPFEVANNAEAMQAMGEDAVQAIPRLTFNLGRLAACRTPTRIFVGAADLVLDPVKHGGLAATALPRARLRVLPGMGHMLHHFHPELIAEAVDELSRPL
jgi:pimeloyl-ACP methyl ester carboxylesterase